MGTIVVLALVVGIILWVVAAYNGLISLKNQVVNGWKQIDVQLKRRHDLIPNLVNTVKGAMDFERSTLDAVITARNRAVGATGVQQTAQRGRGADAGAGTLLCADRGVSRPEGHGECRAAAGGAHQHGEQDRLCAAAL